jgi:hypothetical protein
MSRAPARVAAWHLRRPAVEPSSGRQAARHAIVITRSTCPWRISNREGLSRIQFGNEDVKAVSRRPAVRSTWSSRCRSGCADSRDLEEADDSLFHRHHDDLCLCNTMLVMSEWSLVILAKEGRELLDTTSLELRVRASLRLAARTFRRYSPVGSAPRCETFVMLPMIGGTAQRPRHRTASRAGWFRRTRPSHRRSG